MKSKDIWYETLDIFGYYKIHSFLGTEIPIIMSQRQWHVCILRRWSFNIWCTPLATSLSDSSFDASQKLYPFTPRVHRGWSRNLSPTLDICKQTQHYQPLGCGGWMQAFVQIMLAWYMFNSKFVIMSCWNNRVNMDLLGMGLNRWMTLWTSLDLCIWFKISGHL